MAALRLLGASLVSLVLGYLAGIAMGSRLSGVIGALVVFSIALYLFWEVRSQSRDAGQLYGRTAEAGELTDAKHGVWVARTRAPSATAEALAERIRGAARARTGLRITL